MNESDYNQVYPLGIFEEDNIITTKHRSSSSKKKDNIKTNFDKVIIPYNFKKNNYSVPDNEIEGYENKEFVLNILHIYNQQKLFKFDSPYQPSCCERCLFLLPMLIFLIILYGLVYLIIMFMFNPLVLYISYKILKEVFSLIKSMKNTFYEKMKKKAMNKRLDETNRSHYCIEHKIKWNLGESGYWLEVEKIKN